ncbi:HlyD family type I secretion periplasmic adaptor subunit [Cereibacter sphaeroides]|uniref:HlyD family type I secretion periplasmic adaptor subunit n=1 Tax=Cereibacter sphaeroides TaxID=1063 RepID=UPI000E5B510F|nr:HlyD family type I secretion periplasmic adaptor subunit [Cereibacter sphaeroides]RHZ98479.1 HlyD family type I secretion periplasmic adaptor subunit [Cereibacter sphaeroides]
MSAADAWDDPAPPSYRPIFQAALILILSLGVSLGSWAVYARLDGAVITQGVVLAESRRKTVENLEGGLLERLLVAPGDRVAAGQPVAQLATVQDRERLIQLEAEREGLLFDIWRLRAEAAGAGELDPATAPGPDAERTAAQLRLFQSRLNAHHDRIGSLDREIELLIAQGAANDAQARAADLQIESWRAERADLVTLVDRGASPRQKLVELDRNITTLTGTREQYLALARAARADVERARMDRSTAGQLRLAEVAEQLAAAGRELPGLEAQIRATRDVLERRTLRAPQAGLVVEVPTVTPGAVIGSGTAVMEILPDLDHLVIQMRVPPEAIDNVRKGGHTRVRLTAYRRALAPVVRGQVSFVSPDLIEDPRDGTTYFEAKVTLDPASLAEQPDWVRLSAGMPVEVSVSTGERRAGDYLLEPILRHLRGALHDP